MRIEVVPDLPEGYTPSRVSVDIETSGLDYHQDRIGVVTVYGGADPVSDPVYVVQPPAGTSPKRLLGLLAERAVVKTFHHAPFDLRFLVHHWGAQPQNVRCTKIAAKVADPDGPHSLARLLERHLRLPRKDAALAKSDWFGPLSDEQLAYCAGDVVHLEALMEHLLTSMPAALRPSVEAAWAFLPHQVALQLTGHPNVFTY